MTRSVVCDASAVVALLLDNGPDGRWALNALADVDLHAPSLMPFEAANIIRRHGLTGDAGWDSAAQAHADLAALPIEYWPYELLATRSWGLRDNLTVYDASYVALAEITNSTLVTLDRSMSRAPGLGCHVMTPDLEDERRDGG